ncbi:MAG: hypothetical protein M3Y72_17160 [Acidobacteriota bacterium]|nr:hypothetical protein [Acidobacteriota bacterium]
MRLAYVGASIAALAWANACGEPKAYSVERLEIDSTLHIHPVGARSIPDPTQGSYYFFFNAARLISVDHFAIKPVSKERERLLYLEALPSSLLYRTVKQDEILRGRYGSLYATKACFYDRSLESGYSTVSVGSYYNELGYKDLGHEIPFELSERPKDLPPLTSVSVVRVFRADPEYVIASASYEPDGKLGSLHVDKTEGGDWVTGFGQVTGVSLREDQALMTTWGISGRIDIQRYLRTRRLPITPGTFPEVFDLLNQHYGYDKIIRQDKLSHGVAVSSRFLQPSTTPEEEILNPVCESRFRQQEAAGLRTVD